MSSKREGLYIIVSGISLGLSILAVLLVLMVMTNVGPNTDLRLEGVEARLGLKWMDHGSEPTPPKFRPHHATNSKPSMETPR